MSRCKYNTNTGPCNSPCNYTYKQEGGYRIRTYDTFCSYHTNLIRKLELTSRTVYDHSPEHVKEHAVEEYTCFGCPEIATCPFAFDLYNLDGDCLARK